MKKIFFTILIFFFMFNLQANATTLWEYTKKPYVGMAYSEALNQELPFLLIFAEPKNIVVLSKLMPLVEMVYNDFKGQYNFCIINTSIEENDELVKFFAPKNLPTLYLIDTNNRTYTLIEKRYYNKHALKNILTRFKNGTLFN